MLSKKEFTLIIISIIWICTAGMVCTGFVITKNVSCVWGIFFVSLLTNSILKSDKRNYENKDDNN